MALENYRMFHDIHYIQRNSKSLEDLYEFRAWLVPVSSLLVESVRVGTSLQDQVKSFVEKLKAHRGYLREGASTGKQNSYFTIIKIRNEMVFTINTAMTHKKGAWRPNGNL